MAPVDPVQILVTVLGWAFGYAYYAWQRSKQPFDPVKLVPTFVIGLFVAGFAWYVGTNFDAALVTLQASPIWGGIVAVADQAQGHFASWWGARKIPPPPTP